MINKQNQVYLIKLLNGEEILAQKNTEIRSHSDTNCYVDNPVKLLANVFEQSMYLSVTDWFPGSSKRKSLLLYKEAMIGPPYLIEDSNMINSYYGYVDSENQSKKKLSDIKNRLFAKPELVEDTQDTTTE